MDELEKFFKNHKESFNSEIPNPKLFHKIRQHIKSKDNEGEGDELEAFIKQNKRAFDDQTPNETVWQTIRNVLHAKETTNKPTKVVSVNFVWRMAAGFLLILCASVYLVWKVAPQFAHPTTVAKQELNLEEISPELADAEMYYSTVINEHVNKIESYNIVDKRMIKGFKQDIAQLDSVYSYMKNELSINKGNEMIVGEMINNLQLRVALLNQQLEILERIKQTKNENEQPRSL